MPPRKKVTKTTGDTATSKGRQIPSRKKKVNSNNSSYLFEKIKKKSNVENLVGDWIESYRDDAERAFYDLLVLMAECGGMDGVVSFQDFKDLDVKNGAKEMLKLKDQPVYPLSSKQNKNILNNYKQFWSHLITSASKTIIYDGYFMKMLELWFAQLKSALKRGMRYATAQAAIQITETLIKIANELKKELGLANRQYTSETKNSSRSKQLKENLVKYENSIKQCEVFINSMFRVFDTMFIDILPELRSVCLMPLAQAILAYPGTLFVNKNLEPIRRALNDWMPEPRATAVSALIILYSDENISRLDSFTERAKERIVDIAFCDKVPSICIQAIELVTRMNQHELLEAGDITKITRLYLVDQKDISQAAGKLIYQKHLQDTEELIEELSQKKKDEKFKYREKQFSSLMEFVETSPAPNIPYYAVQSLWPHAKKIFTDWEFYIQYFQDIDSFDLTDRQVGLFCQILNASVKLAVGDSLDIFSIESKQPLHLAVTASKKFGHKNIGKKVLNDKPTTTAAGTAAATTTDAEEDQTDEEYNNKIETEQNQVKVINQEVATIITTQFISVLPSLLVKYRSNAVACENLIEICKYFTLNTYLSSRHQSKYNELLEIIQSVFLLHSEQSLIRATAQTLETLFNNPEIPSQLDAISKTSLQEIYNSIIDSLKTTLSLYKSKSSKKTKADIDEEIISTGENQQQEQQELKDQESTLFSIISNLTKLNELAKQFYFDQEEFEKMIFSFMQGQINEDDEIQNEKSRETIITLSMECYTQTLMWCLFNNNPSDHLLHTTDTKVLRMFYQFCTVALSLLKGDNSDDSTTNNNNKLSHSLRHYVVRNLVEVRSIFSPAYKETLMHSYFISMPRNNDLLEKNIETLFNFEEKYALDSLKVEYLNTQKETQEKLIISKQNRKKKAAEKKSKTTNAAGATSDDEQGKTTTANETSSGMDTSDKETTNDELDQEQREQIDQTFIDQFEFDPLYENRVEELVLSTCFAVRRLIVSPKMVWRLIEMIPLAPNRSIMEIVKTFLSEITMPTVEEEAKVIKLIIKKFHSICISDTVSSSTNFQMNMFSRLKYLIQWISSDFIAHPKSNGLAINDILQEIKLNNTGISKPEELLEILNFLASKSNEQATLYLIKNRIQFDEDYEFNELIEKLYNTIELQTIAEDTKMKKKSSSSGGVKGKGKGKGKSSTTATTTTATSASQKKRKRRSKKKESSSEEEEESSESELSEYSDQDEIENTSDNEKVNQEDIDDENSENSSDFEPSQIQK